MTATRPGPIPNVLYVKWKVVESGHARAYEGEALGIEIECEDMSILTEDDNREVVGCSEWMRAKREVFDHIVSLHNESLSKK